MMGSAGVAMETLLIVWLACIITWFTPTVTAAVSGGELFFFIFTPQRRSYTIVAVCLSFCHSFVRSVCEQDNSRMPLRMLTKHGTHGQGVNL